jgi:hypothetical protein
MNKFLNFVNKNISVFSLLSIVLILFSVFKLITIDFSKVEHIDARLLYYFVIGFAFILLLFDFILKKILVNRIRLNVIQFIVAISFIIIVYFEYFKLTL